MKSLLPCIVAFIAVLASCERAPKQDAKAQPEPEKDSIATFTGIFPCADCDGVRKNLMLYNPHIGDSGKFLLNEEYMRIHATSTPASLAGYWLRTSQDSVGFVFLKQADTVEVSRFKLLENDLLMVCDSAGHTNDSLQLFLRRKRDNDPNNSTVIIRGAIDLRTAERPVLIEKYTGMTLPILKIASYGELEAYWKSNATAETSSLPVVLFGTIETRISMDGRSKQYSLIPEQLVQ